MSNSSLPNVYTYEPLRSPTAIRILVLTPAENFQSPLQYSLLEKNLDKIDCSEEKAQYEAVSYAWGTQKSTCATFCDGNIIYVTPNCQTMMRHLRLRDKVRILWIDAICIDQGLDERCMIEKSSQVLQMDRIYENASTVLVWLGVGGQSVDAVVCYMKRLGKLLQGLNTEGTRDDHLRVFIAHGKARPVVEKLNDLINSIPLVCTNRILWHSPWYYRIWTVQEVAFSRQCLVIIGFEHGYQALPWDEFTNAVEFLSRTNPLPRHVLTAVRLKNNFRKRIADSSPDNLQTLRGLDDLRDWKVSEAKDMIFALQGILKRCCTFTLAPQVDYTKSVDTVYKEAATIFVRETRNPRIFKLACTADRTNVSSSWVPDYHNAFSTNQMWFPDGLRETSSQNVDVNTDGNLKVCGRIIDRVERRANRDLRLPKQGLEDSHNNLHQVMTFQEWILLFRSVQSKTGWTRAVLLSTLVQSYPAWKSIADIDWEYRAWRVWEQAVISQELSNLLLLEGKHDIERHFHDHENVSGNSVEWATQLEALRDSKEWTDEMKEKFSNSKFESRQELSDGQEHALKMHHKLVKMCHNRVLFSTHSGTIGTSLFTVQEGDWVMEVKDWPELFIVRDSGENFSLIGPAYLHGLPAYSTSGMWVPDAHFNLVQEPCSSRWREIIIV